MKRTLLAALLLAFALPADASELTGFRFRQAPDKLRVVFDVDAEVSYEMLTLEEPHRIVIDFKDSAPAASFDKDRQSADLSDTALLAVRSAPRDTSDHRVVLDLREPMTPNDFTLAPAGPYGHRLVVDLTGKAAQSQAKKEPPPPPSEGGLRDVLIAIDAGHGGEDPGTLGVGRLPEKDIVLSISKRLNRLINATDGFKSIMVRDGDYYPALRKRIEFARSNRADVFVSIHADAARNKSAKGASVYTLSERGASSEEARMLADLENNSDLIGGVSEIDLREQEGILAQVLLDISMGAKRVRSIELASSVIKEMDKVAKLRPRPHGEAAFVVLKSPDVPSILIETGYLTNASEYRRLSDANHQERLAKAMMLGITNFIRGDPPPGTRIAATASTQPRQYEVREGDTLSSIASRFGLNTARLRSDNGLDSDRIRVGQVLVIPTS